MVDEDKGDDWGQPPAPQTPENLAKARRARLILGIIASLFIALPFVIYLLRYGWPG